jgi:hypothetical protein
MQHRGYVFLAPRDRILFLRTFDWRKILIQLHELSSALKKCKKNFITVKMDMTEPIPNAHDAKYIALHN